MLPVKDDMAIHIARHQVELKAAGWKLLTCEELVIERLSNKSSMRKYAEEIGQLSYLPTHWDSPEEASYPCILKAAVGEHGQGTHLVQCKEDVAKILKDGLNAEWLLQELIVGSLEYSTSLLVKDGQIYDLIMTQYTYDREQFVWPHDVNEDVSKREFSDSVPPEHLAVMKSFLVGYSGICNFNYKIRPSGTICIFEVNTRIGADLACDVPRPRARGLFEKLDSMLTKSLPHL